jgi:pimeloyl-ACP methyl ester carboxylesterase
VWRKPWYFPDRSSGKPQAQGRAELRKWSGHVPPQLQYLSVEYVLSRRGAAKRTAGATRARVAGRPAHVGRRGARVESCGLPDVRAVVTELEARYHAVRSIGVPTLMIQGGDDRCVLPSSSADKQQYFSGSYARHVLDGIGHFPTREAAPRVSELVKGFLGSSS